ncbi:hypothetical protein, partial [Actinopolymorpha pittospori]
MAARPVMPLRRRRLASGVRAAPPERPDEEFAACAGRRAPEVGEAVVRRVAGPAPARDPRPGVAGLAVAAGEALREDAQRAFALPGETDFQEFLDHRV